MSSSGEQMGDRILSDAFEDRRFILETLQTRIIITTDGRTEIEFTIGDKKHPGGSIVLSSPLNAAPIFNCSIETPPFDYPIVGKAIGFI